MDFGTFLQLLVGAMADGILLGGFYAAVSVGVAISFGMLDIVNIAHPAFIILGAYAAFLVNQQLGLDPIEAAFLMLPVFFALGAAVYQIYYLAFERRGDEALRGLAFFFGLLLVIEVSLVLIFSVDYHYVNTDYVNIVKDYGPIHLPLRTVVPFGVSIALVTGLQLFLSRTFTGRAIMAVSQDRLALQLMAVDPRRIKRTAFGISIATAAFAGAFLIIIQPVQPSVGRDYIGRIFAICVLGGLGSFPGMVTAAILLGVVESITATFAGPSWSPAVSFGILLLTLALRPSGIMGR